MAGIQGNPLTNHKLRLSTQTNPQIVTPKAYPFSLLVCGMGSTALERLSPIHKQDLDSHR